MPPVAADAAPGSKSNPSRKGQTPSSVDVLTLNPSLRLFQDRSGDDFVIVQDVDITQDDWTLWRNSLAQMFIAMREEEAEESRLFSFSDELNRNRKSTRRVFMNRFANYCM